MKIFLAILVLLISASFVEADQSRLPADGYGVTVQGPAPDYSMQQILTVYSTSIDVSSGLWWRLYNPTASGCKFRLMPTSAKASYPQFTIASGESHADLIGKSTKFINYSGCTAGELSRF